MTKTDAIIAVRDVEASSLWYQQLLGARKTHGGHDFAVLESEDNQVLLCLHKWGEHDHPSMKDPDIMPGNGLILYFRTDKFKEMLENSGKMNCIPEEAVHMNPNSLRNEFSLRDPDGYYLIISEFHTYEG